MKDENSNLISRYRFGAKYITDYEQFKKEVFSKTVVPHQVEIQPPPRGKKICWLECPYCYGASAIDNGERFSRERCIQIMEEIATGGVRKIIFAGYATDPLNCEYIDDLLEVAINNKQVFGFNTKALKVRSRFFDLLARDDLTQNSYFSLSVDAGSNEVYNLVHDVKSKAKIYDRVLKNAMRIGEARVKSGLLFDFSAAYLINSHNNSIEEVNAFIKDFKAAGCNMLRFTFAQPPRDRETPQGVVPSAEECQVYAKKLRPIIEGQSTDSCIVMIVDADAEHGIFQKPRTLPCFARFAYPTVGFDGWLYHCSQSSAPNFHGMALGDLSKRGFWDIFYDYDSENLGQYFSQCGRKMADAGCRCDRKEHVLNASVISSGIFDNIINQSVSHD